MTCIALLNLRKVVEYLVLRRTLSKLTTNKFLGKFLFGILKYLLGKSIFDHLSKIHERCAISNPRGLLHVMSYYNDS